MEVEAVVAAEPDVAEVAFAVECDSVAECSVVVAEYSVEYVVAEHLSEMLRR